MPRRISSLAFLVLVSMSSSSNAQTKNFPKSSYEPRTIEGFTVLVNKSLREHPDETKSAMDELTSQLKAIVEVVPAKPLGQLRKVRIWVEWETKSGGAAEFHPSADWLRENGYNPEKAGGIEINNARHFVEWSKSAQPWMILHEMAHAYHFRVLGGENKEIDAAYRHAIDAKLYDSVDFVLGGKKKGYATTDAHEYFAELSEAYFGKNDFFPYTREELQTHDREGYRVLRDAWSTPREPKSDEKGRVNRGRRTWSFLPRSSGACRGEGPRAITPLHIRPGTGRRPLRGRRRPCRRSMGGPGGRSGREEHARRGHPHSSR